MEQKTIDEVKAKHTNVRLYSAEVDHDDQHIEVIVTAPSKTIFDAVKKYLSDGLESKANETLVYGCLKYPDPAAFSVSVKDLPVLFDKLANEILALGGARAEFKITKL